MGARLVRLDSMKCSEVDFKKFLEMSGDILRTGGVKGAIMVDSLNNVVEGNALCDVLRRLGCTYVPVVKAGSEDVEGSLFTPLESLGFYDELSPPPARVFMSTEELLYRNWPTPLVLLKSMSNNSLRVWAKLEWYNPFSCSIKDRIAWYMLRETLRRSSGLKKLYEATSTNTGLALAGLSNNYGLKTRLYVPSTAQQCVDYIFRLLGAEVIRGRASITVEMIEDVREDALRNGALNLNQFENDLNFEAHLRYTAKEIELQAREAGLRLTAVVSGLGTSGHLSGISHYMKNRYGDRVRIIGAQPTPGSIIPGIRRIETGMKWVHLVRVDKIYDVTLEDALEGVINVARGDGIMIGLSGGAVVSATRRAINDGLIADGDVVVIIPDHGLKYVEIIEKCEDYIV
ncbi:MAG: pyridoxal-phosphate dependent enzyme [Zestosphaera sp.]